MKREIMLFCAFIFALSAGCTAPTKIKQDTLSNIIDTTELKNTRTTEDTTQTEQKPKLIKVTNLTPLSTYEDEWTKNTPAGASFAGAYTRLLILSELPADGDKTGITSPLLYNERYWWWRAILGREFSVNLTAKIIVGGFETTIPLSTIGHQSNSDGEQWSRVIHHSKMNFPLFLVKTDGSASIPTVKLSVKGTKSYSSRGAAAAVQVALGVAQASGQPASVVTRISEQSTKDKARAVDDAISKLFGSGITEEHWSDRDLRTWSISEKQQPRGVRVTFRIPSTEQDWNSDPLEVGSWTITFDYPRPSIFSDWRICGDDKLPRCAKTRGEAEKNVHKEINPGEVLNYTLSNGDQGLGTIRAILSQQDWYISAQAALANQNTANATAASLCRRITNEITGLGLNGFDAATVVWAVAKGMPLPDGAPDFAKIKDCDALISPIENARK